MCSAERLPFAPSTFHSVSVRFGYMFFPDMAAATARAVERFPSGQTLIVCDDCPVIWNDLFAHIAALAGQPPPPTGAPLGYPSFRLSNARARAALDWAPFYPSYREGFAR